MKVRGSDIDLAGRDYWDGIWERSGEHRVGRLAYFHHALSRIFDRHIEAGCRICEVGCADSAWIPYFVERGMRVTGIDYSEPGIARLRDTLSRRGLQADLVACDVLDPAKRPPTVHDLVFSLGLVEHFRDAETILEAMRALVRPGGVLVTLVPNLRGAWGALQARVDPEVLAIHIRYEPGELDRHHVRAGFEVLERARYFGIFGPLILSAPAIAKRHPRGHRMATGAVWLIEQAVAWPAGLIAGERAESEALSSHILGVYRRPPAGPPPSST